MQRSYRRSMRYVGTISPHRAGNLGSRALFWPRGHVQAQDLQTGALGGGAEPWRSAAGPLYLAQGDLEQAIRVLEQGLALCRASGGWASWLPALMADLGYAAALQGRLAEGRALLVEGR